jgi:hypothetical protein
VRDLGQLGQVRSGLEPAEERPRLGAAEAVEVRVGLRAERPHEQRVHLPAIELVRRGAAVAEPQAEAEAAEREGVHPLVVVEGLDGDGA